MVLTTKENTTFNFYVSATPKNGGRGLRVGSEDGYLTLERRVMYSVFFSSRFEAERLAAELNRAPIGAEYVFAAERHLGER